MKTCLRERENKGKGDRTRERGTEVGKQDGEGGNKVETGKHGSKGKKNREGNSKKRERKGQQKRG